jgi:hypothetical protein
MMNIQTVTIQLSAPEGDFPGKVAVGHYTVKDNIVTLVSPESAPIDKVRF